MKIKGLFQQSPGWKKLLLLIWFVCLSFIFLYAVSILSAFAIWGNRVFDASFLTDISNPEAVAAMKYLQAFNSMGMFLIPAILLGWISSSSTWTYFGTNTRISPFKLLLVPVLALSMLPISNMLADLNHMIVLPESLRGFESFLQQSEKETEQITHAFIFATDIPTLLINIFVIAVIPAFAEEFFFRGALQKVFLQWSKNIHTAIFITAFIFSLIHFQFYTFVPRLFLGMVFGYLMFYTGNIWVPILAHFINNAAAVFVYYLITVKQIPPESEHIGNTSTITWFAAGLFLSIAAFFVICRKNRFRQSCG